MEKKGFAVQIGEGGKRWPGLRFGLELLAAVLVALLIELGFNYQALRGGCSAVKITDTTVNEDGKLVYQITFADPVYVKKLVVQAAAAKNTSYRVEAAVVNAFGKEETVSITDRVFTELDAAVTNIGKRVRELQVVFNHGEWLEIEGVFVSNEASANWFRVAFFTLVLLGGMLLLFEKKMLLEKLWLVYLIFSLGFGSLLAAGAGSYAVTWDEEVHYKIVHMLSGDTGANDSQAALVNFERKTWAVNTAEEYKMVQAYYNRIAGEAGDTSAYAESKKGYLTHFPMIFAYSAGRLLHLPYTTCYLLGRIGNLLFCTVCMAIAIWLADRKKILLSVIGLLPTVLFQSSMYTYDGVCFSCMTLGVVLGRKAMGQAGRRQGKSLLGAAVLFLLSCAAKPVYAAVFLLLLPPLWKKRQGLFSVKKRKYLVSGLLLVLVTAGLLAAFLVLRPLFLGVLQGNLSYGGDTRGGDTGMVGQVLSILRHPIAFAKMFLRELFSFDNFRNYGEEGENAVLVLNQMFLNFYVLGTMKEVWALVLFPLLLLVFLIEPAGESGGQTMTKAVRWLHLAVVAASVMLVWLAMYLTFTPIGSSSIEGVQARYFLPLALPFANLTENDKIKIEISRLRYTQIALGATLLLSSVGVYTLLIGAVLS